MAFIAATFFLFGDLGPNKILSIFWTDPVRRFPEAARCTADIRTDGQLVLHGDDRNSEVTKGPFRRGNFQYPAMSTSRIGINDGVLIVEYEYDTEMI